PGDDRQLVVTACVAEVARSDLRAHVPAVEWGGGVADTADYQVHVADHRHGVPAEPEVGEPVELRVLDGHLEHRVPGQFMQRGTRAGFLDDQGEDVEPAGGLAAGPAKGPGQPGDVDGCRVTGDGTVGGRVTRIPDQLRIEDPRPRPVRSVGREHGD